MAEMSNLQMTPNTSKLERFNSRTNSTGKLVPPKNGEKFLPRYLRASIGSCHDLCKYGRKDAFEEMKARHSLPRRVAIKENENHNSVKVEISPVKKRTLMVKLKQSPGSNTMLSNMPNKSVQQVMKKSLGIPSSVRSNILAERRKISVDKLKTSISPKSLTRSHETMKKVVSVSTEKSKLSSKAKEKSPSAKSSTCLKLKSLTKTLSSSSVYSRDLNGNNALIIGKKIGTSKVASKKVVVSPKPFMSRKPSLNRAASSNGKKHQSLKKDGSSLMNQNKIKKAETERSKDEKVEQPKSDEVQEKTLYIIKMETENSSFESDRNENCVDKSMVSPSSLSPPSPEISSLPNVPYSSSLDERDSEYTLSESEDYCFSGNSKVESSTENRVSQIGNDKRKSGMMVYEEDKDCSDLKLKLRGKVVDIQSENKWIKYKREKGLLGNKQNLKEVVVRRRSFERIRGAYENKSDAEKVVLRHQDVEGKKKQKLFNNVIKETASKLARTRKSKVKALVGAFETLISLQDKVDNPSAKIVTTVEL